MDTVAALFCSINRPPGAAWAEELNKRGIGRKEKEMDKRGFRIEMMFRQHDVTDLRRRGKGDIDYILYECRCVKCGEHIMFAPQKIDNEIDGSRHCLGILTNRGVKKTKEGKEG